MALEAHNRALLLRSAAAASGSTASSNRRCHLLHQLGSMLQIWFAPHMAIRAEIGVAALGHGDHIHAEFQGFRNAAPEAFRPVQGDRLSWTQGFGA
jgi:hypothetical protein